MKNEAEVRHGGWWYTAGNLQSNLNGKYYSSVQNVNDGIFWNSWKGTETLQETKMMLRSTGRGMKGSYMNWPGIDPA